MATIGIAAQNLPNIVSVPSSINLIATMRVNGVEKLIKLEGFNLNRITDLENRISIVSSLV